MKPVDVNAIYLSSVQNESKGMNVKSIREEGDEWEIEMGSKLEFGARRGGVGEREAREHVEPELQLAALGVAEFAFEQLLHAALFGGEPLVSLLEQPFHRLHVHEHLRAARTRSRTGASA